MPAKHTLARLRRDGPATTPPPERSVSARTRAAGTCGCLQPAALYGQAMPRRLTALLVATIAVGLLAAAPALAALSDEVTAGRVVAARLQRGQVSCQSLSNSDFEHLGEYVMDRMVGSDATHEAMNARMNQVLGAENGDQMHQALGRRYAGCATTNGSGGSMMGGEMMNGGSNGADGWGAMMGSGYAWMRDGNWQHMNRADWQRAGAYMMGSGWMTDPGSGWSTGAIIGVVIGAFALGGLIAYLLLTRRPRRPRPPQPTAA